MRKVIYVTGTRADYGLMVKTLRKLNASTGIDLSLCVTGMHLSEKYANTVSQIKEDGFRISKEVVVELDSISSESMPIALAEQIKGCVEVFSNENPDIVLLLGDRGEMLAGAIAAMYLNCIIVHIHGGERSGSVDESIRHAISKMSHYHLVATDEAMKRLIKMGEKKERVIKVGAPGVEGVEEEASVVKNTRQSVGYSADDKVALMVFHPVVQNEAGVVEDVTEILRALTGSGFKIVCLLPNSDTGAFLIESSLKQFAAVLDVKFYKHLPRHLFLAWLRDVDLMIGNSSSGIIEAASFNTPVVNVGIRQKFREKSNNTIDVECKEHDIVSGIRKALESNKEINNVYKVEGTSDKIVNHVLSCDISNKVMHKCNEY